MTCLSDINPTESDRFFLLFLHLIYCLPAAAGGLSRIHTESLRCSAPRQTSGLLPSLSWWEGRGQSAPMSNTSSLHLRSHTRPLHLFVLSWIKTSKGGILVLTARCDAKGRMMEKRLPVMEGHHRSVVVVMTPRSTPPPSLGGISLL